jgi:hypothetical protein
LVLFTRIYDDLRANDVVVVQLSARPVEKARAMLEHFPVAWPYACDPEGRVFDAYGLKSSKLTLSRVANEIKQNARGLGMFVGRLSEPYPGAMPAARALGYARDQEGGMVLISRGGLIRVKRPTGSLAILPANSEIMKMAHLVNASRV